MNKLIKEYDPGKVEPCMYYRRGFAVYENMAGPNGTIVTRHLFFFQDIPVYYADQIVKALNASEVLK